MAEKKKCVLFIDSTQDAGSEIWRLGKKSAFEELKASSLDEASNLILAHKDSISAIFICEVSSSPFAFSALSRLQNMDVMRRLPIFLITENASYEYIDKALNFGALDVFFDTDNVSLIYKKVNKIIELYDNRNQLEKMFNQQMQTISIQSSEIEGNQWGIIETLGQALESRDVESGNHCNRMKNITEILLKYLAIKHPEYMLTEKKIQLIALVTPLHDIGKIAIPDRILLKPESAGRLTDEEYAIMKTHTIAGCQLLNSIPNFQGSEMYTYAYNICRHHHERWDGRGYPDKLSGENIPIEAQVVSMADVIDALCCKRVYKPAFDKNKTREMILNGECGCFNPAIIECFKMCYDDIYEMNFSKKIEL